MIVVDIVASNKYLFIKQKSAQWQRFVDFVARSMYPKQGYAIASHMYSILQVVIT